MMLPYFHDEERQAASGVRRQWFNVKQDSLPSIFYLPLHQPMSVSAISSASNKIRIARYERIPHNRYPYAATGYDVYVYKGDDYK